MTFRQVLNATWAWLIRQAGEKGAESLLYPDEPDAATSAADDNREAISVLSALSKLPRAVRG